MKRGVLQNRWWIVVASLLAQIVGNGAINVFAFSVFLKPVSNDLHLGRAVLSSALMLCTFLTAMGCLIFGRLFDRGRFRGILLPAIALYSLSVAALFFLQPSRAVVYLLFGLTGIFGVGQTPVGYSKLVSLRFDNKRGLALGIIQAGVGVGGILVPQIARILIHNFGWREAYVGLGAVIFLVAFLPVAVFVRDTPPASSQPSMQAVKQKRTLSGFAASEVLRNLRFWMLALAFFLVVVAANGPLIHAVALLTDRGLSVQLAVTALSAAGMALIVGRMAAGYCLDRFFGPYVAVCCVAGAMIGVVLLGSGAGGFVAITGAILCGLGMGAEGDLLPYFVSRYFGLRSFGQIYGYVFAIFMIGVGVGPYLMGVSFDYLHSYRPMLVIFECALLIACVLFLRLGAYPFPAEQRARKNDRGETGNVQSVMQDAS